MTADISVQATEDPAVRAYHTRFEMTSAPEFGSRGCDDQLGEFGRLMLGIRGVTQVHILPYAMLITKAPLFLWDEVDDKVTDILKGFARSQRLLV